MPLNLNRSHKTKRWNFMVEKFPQIVEGWFDSNGFLC